MFEKKNDILKTCAAVSEGTNCRNCKVYLILSNKLKLISII